MVPFDRPHTISYYIFIAIMSLSCTVSETLSLISQNVKRSRDPEHIPFDGNLSFYALVNLCINQPLKCLVSPTSKILLGKIYETGHVTMTTPIRRSLSSLGYNFIYSNSTYKIWQISFQPFHMTYFQFRCPRASKLKICHVTLTTPLFRGSLSSVGYDMIHSTCAQNLTILA